MRIAQVKEFGAKAGCNWTQQKAHRLYKSIENYLTKEEKIAIAVARSHWDIGEGREEIDEVCQQIIDRMENK